MTKEKPRNVHLRTKVSIDFGKGTFEITERLVRGARPVSSKRVGFGEGLGDLLRERSGYSYPG